MLKRAAALVPLVALAVAATTRAAPPSDSKAKAKVTQIVFIGKKSACPCTKKSVDAGKKALQAVLGKQSRYRLEELNFDVEADRDKVDALREKRVMTALPAIYFLDSTGEVKERLQGDITEAQIRAVLK